MKWVNLPTNCLSVSSHFVGLALKGLGIETGLITANFTRQQCDNSCDAFSHILQLDSFLANVPIFYPLKTPENHKVYETETQARNGLN